MLLRFAVSGIRCSMLLVPVLFFILHLSQFPAFSALYYVAPDGSDTNPGNSSSPWRTITKAANTLIAGDTVFIASGTYPERIIPQNSGSPGNFITYTAQSGAEVVIDGTTITLPPVACGLVQIDRKSYIRISGLQVHNAGRNINNAGIYIAYSDYVIVEKNTTYNTVSSGIGVWNSSNIIIDGNEVELACNDGEQECITVAGTSNFEVRNNNVHHNGPGTIGGEGIDAKDGSANGRISGNTVHDLSRLGIYVDAWKNHTHDIEVYGNRVSNCRDDGIALGSEMGGLLENISIFNNIVVDNRYNGISVTSNGDADHQPMRRLSIINNTIHNNGDDSIADSWGGGISVDNTDIDTLVIRNNIFSQNLYFQILVDVPVKGLSVDHNLIDGFRGFANEVKGNSFVEGNPDFVNQADGDYHLGIFSPAIDSGTAAGAPEEDFESLERPQGTGYDIGAYEYILRTSPISNGVLMLLL